MRKTMYCVMSKNKISQTVTPAVAPPPGRTNSHCRILVVDQNDDFRVLCADALTSPGCRVDAAEDGATAWRALQAHHYSLLITENKLPNLIGDELIRKLHSARMDVPVVIVAGGLPALEPSPNSPCHCAATLFKPFALDRLLDTVKNVLPNAKQAQESPPSSSDNLGHPIAVTLSVRGKCDYCEDGARFIKLERGHILKQGAIVRTGSDARADLLLRRTGASVRLQAGTEIRLEKMALTVQDGLPMVHTSLALHVGRLCTLVHSTVAGSTLEIRNAARSTAERSVVSRCIITADGTHIWAQDSAIPIKVRSENGSTIIAAGSQRAWKNGQAIHRSKRIWV